MALAAVQAALARLFTDAPAREAFARDPLGAGRGLGLDEADARVLAALAPRALDRFAGSLRAKRALDLRKALPATALALGDDFAARVREALADPPRGVLADAFALAAALAAKPRPAWIGDLARWEATGLEAGAMRWGVKARAFRYPVATIAARLVSGEALGEVAPRRAWSLWFRGPGGRLQRRSRS